MTPQRAARRAMFLTLGFDSSMAALSMVAASVLVWSSDAVDGAYSLESAILSTSVFVLAMLIGFLVRGVQKQVWRHMGWPDAVMIVQAIGLSTLFYLPIMLVLNGRLVAPWATLLVATLLWTLLLFAGRMIALSRSTHTPLQIFSPVSKTGQPVLLVGDADSCVPVLRRLQGQGPARKVRVLGVVEMEGADPGRAIRGVPIMGCLEDLGNVIDILRVRYGQTPWLAVTGVARERKGMLKVLEIAASHGAEVMAFSGDEAAQILEPVHPADLLARAERRLDIEPGRNIITGASVLVTGGGGTIGSELTRQVAALKPATLTIIDASEFNLYSIDMALRSHAPNVPAMSRLGDVRDISRLTDVFQRAQPDLVIHAAALKHVPLMEHNLCEAILTNVGGAVNAARAAVAVGARRFVFISTDKAVDPDNVMGATKRLAEIAVSRIAADSRMTASMVRFGNVLGSSGSVVPLFERQIAAGGPVTLTDPGVTRYFMTVEEASSLVLQAAALQAHEGDADLFVLDMGEPIAILQLAETMIRLKGLVPGVDIEIVTTGLRDGEKMHEALTYSHEEIRPTEVDGVNRVASPNGHGELFEKQLAALLEAAARRERSEALRLLGVLVPEYGANRAERNRRQSA
ncbi:polysaccharide biosynthesis protein [Hyphomonas oceanitis]|uniref:Polysaccharide biosynthesis protein n=1 Tax=Hyphomonas oceanitis SCH89 TaxID=1280953 RepID=A0A059G939_9PROT|nr:polysaccharide biosynthesis protein [Hyphomonas oceanitis]KDA03352.1 polysaccharide biosynthesis protein [Hyphomonas oceanitis SCH89]